STKPGGLGMGLAISRSIVEAHGGRIVAEANPDRGLTLRVELPGDDSPAASDLEAAPPGTIGPLAWDQQRMAGGRKRLSRRGRAASSSREDDGSRFVYVLDDDVSLLRALRRLLHAGGFQVKTFSSAEDFLGCPNPRTPGCLVLDVHLGGLGGFELHERLVASG